MEDRRGDAARALAGHGVAVRDIVDIVNSASEDALDTILGKIPDVDGIFNPDGLELRAYGYVGKERRQFWEVYAGSYRAGDPPLVLIERAMHVVDREVFEMAARMGQWELEKAS